MFVWWEPDATVREKSSMEESITPLGIEVYREETYMRRRRVEIQEPWGVPTETDDGRLREPWRTIVQDLSERKEESQSTM